jgi:hypothetical protein
MLTESACWLAQPAHMKPGRIITLADCVAFPPVCQQLQGSSPSFCCNPRRAKGGDRVGTREEAARGTWARSDSRQAESFSVLWLLLPPSPLLAMLKMRKIAAAHARVYVAIG